MDETSDDAEALVAMLGAALLLGSLAIYGQWVLAGAVEEKSNRVVELILSTVKPRHLLIGKVIGIGVLGLTQLALIAGLGAALLAAGVYDAPKSLGGSLALVVPWFALYAVAYAAAGALAGQQQDARLGGTAGDLHTARRVLRRLCRSHCRRGGFVRARLDGLPSHGTARTSCSERARGRAAVEHALALTLVLGAIHALVRFAGRIYAQGLLHAGSRLRVRAAWRLIRE